MNLREIVWEVVDWIHLAQDSDQCVNLIMNLWFPCKTENFLII